MDGSDSCGFLRMKEAKQETLEIESVSERGDKSISHVSQ